MLGIQEFWLFVVAGLLLNVTPGPDMAFIVGRSTQYGTRAGVAAALGIGAGCFVHIAAAAAGVSALLAASELAFQILKWVGAAYLVYLGLHMLLASARGAHAPAARDRAPHVVLRSVFLQGFLTNVLNPKVALFFLAFLPQFIRGDAPAAPAAFLVLGLVFNATGTVWNLGVAWFTGRLTAAVEFRRAPVWLERALGGMFVALGIRLVLADRS
jgi:threonine/homoserine/homoserine lactone efflux protein